MLNKFSPDGRRNRPFFKRCSRPSCSSSRPLSKTGNHCRIPTKRIPTSQISALVKIRRQNGEILAIWSDLAITVRSIGFRPNGNSESSGSICHTKPCYKSQSTESCIFLVAFHLSKHEKNNNPKFRNNPDRFIFLPESNQRKTILDFHQLIKAHWPPKPATIL
jgi:hypothetical protein